VREESFLTEFVVGHVTDRDEFEFVVVRYLINELSRGDLGS